MYFLIRKVGNRRNQYFNFVFIEYLQGAPLPTHIKTELKTHEFVTLYYFYFIKIFLLFFKNIFLFGMPHGMWNLMWIVGKNTRVEFLLQGIFPTQESNPGLPHCRQILYHLNHEGSHLVPPPGIRPEPPALEGQSLNHWTPREVPNLKHWKVVGNYMPNWFLFFLVWLYSIIIMVIGEIKMEF